MASVGINTYCENSPYALIMKQLSKVGWASTDHLFPEIDILNERLGATKIIADDYGHEFATRAALGAMDGAMERCHDVICLYEEDPKFTATAYRLAAKADRLDLVRSVELFPRYNDNVLRTNTLPRCYGDAYLTELWKFRPDVLSKHAKNADVNLVYKVPMVVLWEFPSPKYAVDHQTLVQEAMDYIAAAVQQRQDEGNDRMLKIILHRVSSGLNVKMAKFISETSDRGDTAILVTELNRLDVMEIYDRKEECRRVVDEGFDYVFNITNSAHSGFPESIEKLRKKAGAAIGSGIPGYDDVPGWRLKSAFTKNPAEYDHAFQLYGSSAARKLNVKL